MQELVIQVANFFGVAVISPADYAAWIQAIGSVFGIFIAILVPYLQRSGESYDRRFDRAERVASLTQAEFFTVGECISFLQTVATHAKLGLDRHRLVDEPVLQDLVSRLADLDSRETHYERGIAIFHARNYVLRINSTLRADFLKHIPLLPEDLIIIEDAIRELKKQQGILRWHSDICRFEFIAINSLVLARPILYLLAWLRRRRRGWKYWSEFVTNEWEKRRAGK